MMWSVYSTLSLLHHHQEQDVYPAKKKQYLKDWVFNSNFNKNTYMQTHI